MKIIPTAIPDVVIIEPKVFGDERGFFMETWNQQAFAKAGLDFNFVQDNHSRSRQGILRGLHYQIQNPQGKLVRVTHKCTNLYAPEHERCVRWNDPDLNIPWPLVKGEAPQLSAKDAVGALLKDAEVFA